jgi:alpha-galactosidase
MAYRAESEVVAQRVPGEIALNAADPSKAWASAIPVRFAEDWQGKNPDPGLQTEVRILWTPATIYLRFVCSYHEITVFQDSDRNGRRDHLWDRDVAEAFLQPKPSPERYYREFEVAPNGMWIDLDIAPSGLADLKSGLTRSVHMDEPQRLWVAELAIPIEAVTPKFKPNELWRANFYRVEGRAEPRRYMAWQPTHTPRPNFHVPKAFGTMRFVE